MCRIRDSKLLPIWEEGFGNTYHEVTGRRLVEFFRYFGETYTIGDVVEIYTHRGQEAALVAELVTAGSNVPIKSSSFTEKTSRRAIILKIIRSDGSGGYRAGDTFPAFLWGHDDKRMRHAPLETLARV